MRDSDWLRDLTASVGRLPAAVDTNHTSGSGQYRTVTSFWAERLNQIMSLVVRPRCCSCVLRRSHSQSCSWLMEFPSFCCTSEEKLSKSSSNKQLSGSVLENRVIWNQHRRVRPQCTAASASLSCRSLREEVHSRRTRPPSELLTSSASDQNRCHIGPTRSFALLSASQEEQLSQLPTSQRRPFFLAGAHLDSHSCASTCRSLQSGVLNWVQTAPHARNFFSFCSSFSPV